MLLGYNRVREKADGEVLVRCGSDPLLAVGTFGKGRTVAFTSDCSPHWATPEFTGWSMYPRLWTQTIRWLAGEI